jgi:hypothetical protein
MILDKEKLSKDGYLYFNLKDIDNNLYNELYNNFNKNIARTKRAARITHTQGFDLFS